LFENSPNPGYGDTSAGKTSRREIRLIFTAFPTNNWKNS
jgi:hypothetical protein